MTRDEIDIMWQKAMQEAVEDGEMYTRYRFAKLVARHTLLNTDPSSFMSYQEGVEVGRFAEREACAKMCEDAPEPDGADLAERIRARGNT